MFGANHTFVPAGFTETHSFNFEVCTGTAPDPRILRTLFESLGLSAIVWHASSSAALHRRGVIHVGPWYARWRSGFARRRSSPTVTYPEWACLRRTTFGSGLLQK
jgi:hypothetical protein